MKILKIKIVGLPLFNEPFEIDFYANQKVNKDKNENLNQIFGNIYTNNVISAIGINASGKTTTLKVISFVIQLLKNKPISNITCNEILRNLLPGKEVNIETFFYDKQQYIYKLETTISKKITKIGNENDYKISKEILSRKGIKSIRSKKMMFEFSSKDILQTRKNSDVYLLDDVSIMIGLNRENNYEIQVIDSIEWTDFNGLRILGDFPLELIKFLDPSIEYLKCEKIQEKDDIKLVLKFMNSDEIHLNSPLELNKYLSSGTIKGVNVFIAMMITLANGGYLILDELENHFNIEIVSTLIRFFTDNSTNKYGATLVFSTHYTELIDIIERNDAIYVIRNIGGIKVDNLNKILGRNDVKKSEWFQSGYLEYTTPSYQGYIDFKRKLKEFVQKRGV
ncbi:AAA family ATPase [Cetobacterium sp.]|uniref:AAA family ATPase n=1 Tax=Cetobacterium sp. TaxID=2071632 RepID=UPI003F3AD430